MRAKLRRVSLSRKFVIDYMRVSEPLVVLKRSMQLGPLVSARATSVSRPSWASIFAKAFSLVASQDPTLRSFYLRWPVPHFYEAPYSVATIAVARPDLDDGLVGAKISSPDRLLVKDVDSFVREAKTAPLESLPSISRVMLVARLPFPFRHIAWALALNVGRLRCNNFGTFTITSVGSLGVEQVVLRSPGPTVLSYAKLRTDHSMEVAMHWDHRIYDALKAAQALRQLENVLNTVIADELRQPSNP